MLSDLPGARFSDVSVKYGPVIALDGLDLEIPARGVFGLLGRNGAGKTTAIRTIVGLVRPFSGTLQVFGTDPAASSWNRDRISVLFAEDGLIPSLTVLENLSVWACFRGMPRSQADEMGRSILQSTGIPEISDVQVKELSTGNRRLAALARTFLLPSDMVILDEPTASLDPVRASEVRKAIDALSESRLVLLSTHNLPEAEELCDSVAIIDSGRVLLTGSPGKLAEAPGMLLVRTEGGNVTYRGSVLEPGSDGYVLLDDDDEPALILRELIECGNRVTEFRPYRRDLASLFLELTGESS